MRGIILAGGKGTRLLPATKVTNKHLVPILNTPMVLYPVETLKSFGITDIMVVTGDEHVGRFIEFLGDGSAFGVSFTFRSQREAGGIAQALALAEDFAHGEPIVVCLGDNIFDNSCLDADVSGDEMVVFLKEMPNLRGFGVPTLQGNKVVAIEEKPENPKSKYAVTGLYYYPPDVFETIRQTTPSARGEFEITGVNDLYAKAGRCKAVIVDGFWVDAGSPESLYLATRWEHERRLMRE